MKIKFVYKETGLPVENQDFYFVDDEGSPVKNTESGVEDVSHFIEARECTGIDDLYFGDTVTDSEFDTFVITKEEDPQILELVIACVCKKKHPNSNGRVGRKYELSDLSLIVTKRDKLVKLLNGDNGLVDDIMEIFNED